MNQKIVGLCAALLFAGALVVPSGRAAAQVEPNGAGIGADVALAAGQMNTGGVGGSANLGVGGLSLMYWLSESLALNFIARAGFTAPNGDDVLTQLGLGAGLFGVIARGDATTLQLGGRFSVGAVIWSNDRSVAVVGLEVPLRVEHWFDRNFSVNGQVGISVGIAPREGEGIPFTMEIGSVTGWGGIGFIYYFSPAGGMPAPGGGGGGAAPPPTGGGYQPPPPTGGGDPETGGAGW